ncbi:MAG: NAD(P)-dependent alcohol dehydrogenase [Vicinamibacterales bacterium]
MSAFTASRPAGATPSGERTDTMQAISQRGYGGPDVFSFGSVPRPRIAADELLVRVESAGLDRGTWHLMTGRPYPMRLMGFGFRRPKQTVPGLDVAGTVVEVGSAVTRFTVGDAVFGIAKGSYAELAPALETKLARKPASLSFDEAAVLAVSGGTALQAIDQAGSIGPGARVLVIGASGGVGSYAVQLTRAMGAHVTGVSSPAKVALVRSFGADVALDYRCDDFLAEQYDVILDVGGNTALRRLRRALTADGVLVFVGGEHGGDWTGGFERQLAAAALGPFTRQRFVMLMAKEHFEPMERLAAFASTGQLKPAISQSWPLADMPDAMRALMAGTLHGKAVIRVR